MNIVLLLVLVAAGVVAEQPAEGIESHGPCAKIDGVGPVFDCVRCLGGPSPTQCAPYKPLGAAP